MRDVLEICISILFTITSTIGFIYTFEMASNFYEFIMCFMVFTITNIFFTTRMVVVFLLLKYIIKKVITLTKHFTKKELV